MYQVLFFLLTILFLCGTFFLTSLIAAFRRIHKRDSLKQMKNLGMIFFYRPFHLFFFPANEYEGLFFATSCAQNIVRFFYAVCTVIFLSHTEVFKESFSGNFSDFSLFWIVMSSLSFILLSFIVGDYLPRIFGSRLPEKALTISAPLSSLFLYLVFPLTYLFLKTSKLFSRNVFYEHYLEPDAEAKKEIIEMIQEAELSPTLDMHDKKLFESVLTFKERIAREVMVPRVNVFSLSVDTSIQEAAKLLHNEGYSRTPVYRNTVDNIVGVLMYKDLLKKYTEAQLKGDPKILEAPIETIQKNVLYTPETKKISSLLQEFRKKQVHLAIVVDEYGGTEGIVTIEDILEEIVGEIADEYDQEAQLFKAQPDGSWIIDARMNILDVEEQLGIRIPSEGDYDTIGGYIFHCTGSIPSEGFVIHRDDFEIEILSSSDRSVEKVKIKQIDHQIKMSSTHLPSAEK